MAFANAMCAVSAALAAGASSSISLSAPASAAVAPQGASYFQSDVELTAMLRDIVAQGESKGLVLGLLEPDGRRRVIAFGSAGEGSRAAVVEDRFRNGLDRQDLHRRDPG